MVKMVVGIVLLVVAAILMLVGVGLVLLFAVLFVWEFIENRRLVRILACCPCPHCSETLGRRSAQQAFRDWDRAPSGFQPCRRPNRKRTGETKGNSEEEELQIIHVTRDPNWRVHCNRCGQHSLFDVTDLIVYRGEHVGNDKLHAIADVMSEKDIEQPLPPERLDAICQASGCDRIDVLWVINMLKRLRREFPFELHDLKPCSTASTSGAANPLCGPDS